MTAALKIIPVFYQPASLFPQWKKRGATTILGYPVDPASNLEQWKQAARLNGLTVILQADVCRPQDYADDLVIAIAHVPDEPDGAGGQTPEQMIGKYQAIKAKTSKPVLINLDASRFPFTTNAADVYGRYCQAADWIAFDYYPLARGDGPTANSQIGQAVKNLLAWSGGKPVIAFIETSDQLLKLSEWGKQVDPNGNKMRAPTAAEFLQEIQTAEDAGASIAYFADVVGRSWISFDGTTADIEAAMMQMAKPSTPPPPAKRLVTTVAIYSDGSVTVTPAV